MRISYNWLKQYINTDLSAESIAEILTNVGLEVEGIEKVTPIPGGLEGLVIGLVKTREKHPNADKLSVTTVDIGTGELLNIVCGAPNVAAGQKVIVAPVGSSVHPTNGKPFEINKAKIRGEVSEGMICAEDEIGLGTDHGGIMVLPEDAPIGILAKEYFNLSDDKVFEIGLTPNRVDASSHLGVARDLAAFLNQSINIPEITLAKPVKTGFKVQVEVENTNACPRYSGICIENVTVAESPDWLKNKLIAIGQKTINNVVDITNYVLHETGQPLHAFDGDKIKGGKVIVKNAAEGAKFITLDGVERKLSSTDLMICNATDAMCIAGVFGGLDSGVTTNTTKIFLESAYFNAVDIRKTAKRHALKTDASFRFERGTDPNATLFALQRAAQLIVEIAGGNISSDITDIYPKKINNTEITYRFAVANSLIGKAIPQEKVKMILRGLGIEILKENKDSLLLSIPTAKVDVTREVDVIEEVLRIYGYNNIEIPAKQNASLSYSAKPDREKLQNLISNLLSDNGFTEIMTNSLTASVYHTFSKEIKEEENVPMLNPLSKELDVLRQSLLFSGLETIAYNQNRQQSNIKAYEFGNIYRKVNSKYIQETKLVLFATGTISPEHWQNQSNAMDIYYLKAFLELVCGRLGLQNIQSKPADKDGFSSLLQYTYNTKVFAEVGQVSNQLLLKFDINKPVFYAQIDWDRLVKWSVSNSTTYKDVPKFPIVRRDLSLMVDKNITFGELKTIALQTERQLLKEVNIFDVYQGDKIEKGKKSYALSFEIQDESKTLTDKQIDAIIQKLIANFEKIGAEIRK